MNKAILIAAFSATLFTQAYAAPVTVSLNAEVTAVTGILSNQIAAGDILNFSFTFDSSTPHAAYVSDHDSFRNSNPFNINASSSRFNSSWASTSNEMQVTNDLYYGAMQYYDYFGLFGDTPTLTTPVQGQTPITTSLRFYDGRENSCYRSYPWTCSNAIPMLSSASLPTSITTYEDGYFSLGFANGSTSTVSFNYVVPVPAALWLLGSGLLGLAGVARRKQQK